MSLRPGPCRSLPSSVTGLRYPLKDGRRDSMELRHKLLGVQMTEQSRNDSSRGHRSSNANERTLPPIREMFADELDLPPRPGAYSFQDVQRALPRPETTRSSTPVSSHRSRDHGMNEQPHGPYSLALPIQQQTGAESYRRPFSPSQAHSPSSGFHQTQSGRHATQRDQDQRYSYSVLRTSGTSGVLVNATPPSERPQGILRQTAAATQEDFENSTKRHRCDYCGKRFGMPSHLQIHLRTHTAERPYACEWPNCDRTFSVRSNMVRHFRSHSNSGQQNTERSRYEGDEDLPNTHEPSSSSRYARDLSSSHHYTSSSQYYSSRRK